VPGPRVLLQPIHSASPAGIAIQTATVLTCAKSQGRTKVSRTV
jgi:hypothetical protein